MSAHEETLRRLPRVKVLVLGDLIVDAYLEGTVERISPEAPVPVLEHKKLTHRLGGAANVALNLSSLGIEV
ncbi:MAG: D-glycero-beta-D-manno-heptose-7-phosphate kinase, partial [Spirochaetia bacterium]|nr:D-glycero-beta-D-manno-heptose-7-phosphate kinase [Spirochaetia bacterium]